MKFFVAVILSLALLGCDRAPQVDALKPSGITCTQLEQVKELATMASVKSIGEGFNLNEPSEFGAVTFQFGRGTAFNGGGGVGDYVGPIARIAFNVVDGYGLEPVVVAGTFYGCKRATAPGN